MPVRVRRDQRRSEKELGEGGGRMAAFGVLLALWLGVLGFRLIDLQVAQHQHFLSAAEGQQQTIVELDAPRGAILDARGRELAVSVQVQSVYANPRELSGEVGKVARTLAPLLGFNRARSAKLEASLHSKSSFVWVARKLDPERAQRIVDLELPGIHLLEESRRDYPMGTLAGPVLGYVGLDNQGLEGLEYFYDSQVVGRSARRRVLRDASGTRFVAGWSLEETPQPGADLILTLDASLQHIAERELAESVRQHRARAGVVVVLDARDSAVLAMANYPSFDPNRFASFAADSRRNRAVLDAYEPGSTFKMITAAAALDTLTVRPDDLFDCENGALFVEGIRIGDHKPFGVLSFREVLAKSSNVGTIKAAMRVGSKPLYDAVQQFGFGSRTGIDLPGETAGIVRGAAQWNTLATAYASFGHGLSVSPIQLANAYAALAAGAWHQPYLVAGLRRGDDLETLQRAQRPLSISAATRKDLIRLLEGVTKEGGTGKSAAIDGYRVAGKTGTAQKSDNTGYSETGRVASFVGLAPAGRPRLVVLVMIDEPKDVTGGGVVAGPVFHRIVEESLLYLGVAPDRELWDPRSDFLALRRPTVPAETSEGGFAVASLFAGRGR